MKTSVLNSDHYSLSTTDTILLFIALLCFLFSPVSCLNQLPNPSLFARGLLLEEKIGRVGSIPPRCHNKCNQCHPCMAVQVPTLPSDHKRAVQPGFALSYNEGRSSSNYKPLGWKCSCGSHFFNP